MPGVEPEGRSPQETPRRKCPKPLVHKTFQPLKILTIVASRLTRRHYPCEILPSLRQDRERAVVTGNRFVGPIQRDACGVADPILEAR